MDRDFANEAGSRDSKILVNGLDYDIKGGTQQNFSIILSPLENTINIINDHNSNLHLMPLLYLNTMAGTLVIKIHEINSNASDNKITNDNCKPTETLLGINKRRKLPNNLGYYPKEGIHHVLIIALQRHDILTNNEKDDDLPQEIPIPSNMNNILLSPVQTDTWIAAKHNITSNNVVPNVNFPRLEANMRELIPAISSTPMEDGEIPQSETVRGLPAKPPDRSSRTDK